VLKSEDEERAAATEAEVDSTTTRARTGYLGSLDSLRGVGMVAVLFAHLDESSAIRVGGLRGTWLAVSMFFTLSGFLICRQLLIAWDDNGRADLIGFWKRRANRLLPAAFLCIGVVMIFTATGTLRQPPGFRHEVLTTIFYTNNWYRIRVWTSGSFGQFWSLSIEEQFYLVFPLAFVFLARRLGRRAGAVYAGAAVAGFIYTAIIVSPGNVARVNFGTDTRFAEILAGVAFAYIALTPRYLRLLETEWFVRASQVAGALGIACYAFLWTHSSQTLEANYRLPLWINVLATIGLIACALARGPVARALELRPLMWLGLISYSAYVYHMQINELLTVNTIHVTNTAALATIRLTATIVLSWLSYRFYERHFRRQRTAPTRKIVTMYGSATIVLVLMALFIPLPGTYYQRLLNQYGGGGFAAADRTTNEGSYRVVVLGDQLAERSLPGLHDLIATQKGKFWVSARISPDCPIGGQAVMALGGREIAPAHACSEAAFLQSAFLYHDAGQQTIIQGGVANLADRRTSDGAWQHLGQAAFDAVELRRLRYIVNQVAAKPAERVDWFLLDPDQAIPEFRAMERRALAASGTTATEGASPAPASPSDAELRRRVADYNALVRRAAETRSVMRVDSAPSSGQLDESAWQHLLPTT
jgi:peptidoglycan/LPS O-acetylase OafA/YrhL